MNLKLRVGVAGFGGLWKAVVLGFLGVYVIGAHAYCPPQPTMNTDVLRSQYSASIVRIWIRQEKQKSIFAGTGTIIHRLGYVVTASHVFDQNARVPEALRKPGTTVSVYVENGFGISADGRLWRTRDSTSGPDIAVIQLSSPTPDNIRIPEIALGWEVGPKNTRRPFPEFYSPRVVTFGYREGNVTLDGLALHSIGFEEQQGQVLIRLDTAEGLLLNGQSGSPAFSPDGVALGVLRGLPEEIYLAGNKYLRFRFTPTAYVVNKDWLMDVPLSIQIREMLGKARENKIEDSDYQLIWSLSNFETWQLARAIEKNDDIRLAGNNFAFGASLFNKLNCSGMQDLALIIAQKKMPPQTTAYLRVDAARGMFRAYNASRKQKNDESISVARLRSALSLFSFLDPNPPFSDGSRYLSNVYVDYAKALQIAAVNYPRLGASKEDAAKYAEAATNVDSSNWLAWDAFAVSQRSLGKRTVAADAYEKAMVLHKAPYETKEFAGPQAYPPRPTDTGRIGKGGAVQ